MKIIDQYKKINKLIEEASSIFVVGHKDLDLDALGACLSMYSYVSAKKSEVYFIVDDVRTEKAVAKVIKELSNTIKFIKGEHAIKLKNHDSLLIILDTNKDYLLQNDNLNSAFDNKIVVDHHGEGDGTIYDSLLIIDNDASSTCEMMTEFLKLNDFVIDSYLATILLSGIILDTNNYVLKTDSNTFYYSYYLTTCGAKPTKVQYLLKQDLKKYIKRQKMITNVKIINNIAITKGPQNEIFRREEIAKTADTLLLFNKIEASFVVARIDKDKIGVSARSMGKLNVGQVLGMLGGGGDIHEAAVKLNNTTVNKVENEILNIIKIL